MLTPEIVDATARACFEMHRTRARYRPLDTALRAVPLDDAYRIQDALHRVVADPGRGEIAGWKIALISKAIQQLTGVDQPAAGAIFSTVVHSSPARLDVRAYHHLGVDYEVAVRLGDDLRAGGGPWTRASVADPAAACMPAFELVEDADADYKTLDAFILATENTWNGGPDSARRLARRRPRERRDPLLGQRPARRPGQDGRRPRPPLRGRGVAGQPPQPPRPHVRRG
jgi:2-keto-4-pentenoate hydratase